MMHWISAAQQREATARCFFRGVLRFDGGVGVLVASLFFLRPWLVYSSWISLRQYLCLCGQELTPPTPEHARDSNPYPSRRGRQLPGAGFEVVLPLGIPSPSGDGPALRCE